MVIIIYINTMISHNSPVELGKVFWFEQGIHIASLKAFESVPKCLHVSAIVVIIDDLHLTFEFMRGIISAESSEFLLDALIY